MKRLILLGLLFLLPGCAVRYACPAPEGVRCQPISEVYATTEKEPMRPTDSRPAIERRSMDDHLVPPDGIEAPLRTAPKILRVWLAPWIDQEGDLHREGELFLVIHTGGWTLGESLPKDETIRSPEKAKPLIPPAVREEPLLPFTKQTEDPDAP